MKKLLLIFVLITAYSCSNNSEDVPISTTWVYSELGGTGMFSIPLVDQYFEVGWYEEFIYVPIIYNGGFEGAGEVKTQLTEAIKSPQLQYLYDASRAVRLNVELDFDILVSSNNTHISPTITFEMNKDGITKYHQISRIQLNKTCHISGVYSISIPSGNTMGIKLMFYIDEQYIDETFLNEKSPVRIKIMNVGDISISEE